MSKNVSIEFSSLPSSAANALVIDSDGWTKLSAYGDFPNPGLPGSPAHIQRVDKAAGERMAANFRPLLKRLLRAHVGLPVFKGHPDAPGLEKTFPDKTPYGTISGIEARNDGVYVKPTITPDGSKLVSQGWKFLSSFWNQEEIGTAPDGRPITSPFELKSVGLVLRPNIPGPAINSAPETEPIQSMYRQLLVQLLTALGCSVSADVSDADLQKAVQECVAEEQAEEASDAVNAKLTSANADLLKQVETLTASAETLTKEKDAAIASLGSMTKEKETLAANVATLTSEKSSAEKARDDAIASTTAVRSAAANSLAAIALSSARLQPGEKEATVSKLIGAANFAEEADKIVNLPSKLKTHGVTAGLDKNTVIEAKDRQAKVLSAVNAYMAEKDCDYDVAFIAVQNDPKFATLFGAMKQPEKSHAKK